MKGGTQKLGHNGGYCGNASDLPTAETNYGGRQGASIFIVAQTLDGLSLNCLSTGGAGGNISSKGQSTSYVGAGKAGGCGYGGGGASFRISGNQLGGQGGVHGGGSGSSNSDDSKWSGGGGSSGFCTVYANKVTNQSTTNLLFD